MTGGLRIGSPTWEIEIIGAAGGSLHLKQQRPSTPTADEIMVPDSDVARFAWEVAQRTGRVFCRYEFTVAVPGDVTLRGLHEIKERIRTVGDFSVVPLAWIGENLECWITLESDSILDVRQPLEDFVKEFGDDFGLRLSVEEIEATRQFTEDNDA